MELVAEHRRGGSHRRGSALVLAAIVAALSMAIASPAQAAPSVATAWGLNHNGQLGDGTTTGPETCGPSQTGCSTTPVVVSGLSGVTSVAGGPTIFSHFSLALLETGAVRAWGDNGQGQLGNGTKVGSDVAVAVSGLSGVTAISAGEEHGLALLSNGTVMAWGYNGSGQLGDGTFEGSDTPVPVCAAGTEGPCPTGPYLTGVTAIAAGASHNLALLSNGTVMAWGDDGAGQLGNGATKSSNVPVEVGGLSGVKAIAAGASHSLALLSNGTVEAWGRNEQGQLGNGTETNSDVPVAVSGLTGVTAISGGGQHSLAQLAAGTVKAWGSNEQGQLGNGSSTGPETCGLGSCSKTPVTVSALNDVSAIAAGGQHSLALLRNGAVEAWGANGSGQLGDGTSSGPEACGLSGACSTTPVAVKQAGAVIKGIAGGGQHSLAFGSPAAPANLPEAGRCVKVAAGSGKYTSGTCLTLAKRESAKKYEWVPASLTEKLAFSGSGLETTLTNVGHPTIKCIAANLTGEWTGPKTASVNVEFQGCVTAAGAQCQTVNNPQNKSEIALKEVLGELGYIKYEEVEGKLRIAVGLDLKPYPPGNPSLATYECTGSGEKGHIEGSVIGKLTPINKITTESKLLYLATKSGEQRPEYFQGTPKDTLVTSFTSGLPEESKGSGASSLNIKEYKGQNANALEIKAK